MISKKRGPAPTGKGTPVMVRVQPELLAFIDAVLTKHDELKSRPEAVRFILGDWAAEHPYYLDIAP